MVSYDYNNGWMNDVNDPFVTLQPMNENSGNSRDSFGQINPFPEAQFPEANNEFLDLYDGSLDPQNTFNNFNEQSEWPQQEFLDFEQPQQYYQELQPMYIHDIPVEEPPMSVQYEVKQEDSLGYEPKYEIAHDHNEMPLQYEVMSNIPLEYEVKHEEGTPLYYEEYVPLEDEHHVEYDQPEYDDHHDEEEDEKPIKGKKKRKPRAKKPKKAKPVDPNKKHKRKKTDEFITQNGFRKPHFSYSALVTLALMNAPGGKTNVADVYRFLYEHFPFFREAPSGWKNSVRHNLSLNKSFLKVEQTPTERAGRKSCFWRINPRKMEKLQAEIYKYRERMHEDKECMLNYPELLEECMVGKVGHPPPEKQFSLMPSSDEAWYGKREKKSPANRNRKLKKNVKEEVAQVQAGYLVPSEPQVEIPQQPPQEFPDANDENQPIETPRTIKTTYVTTMNPSLGRGYIPPKRQVICTQPMRYIVCQPLNTRPNEQVHGHHQVQVQRHIMEPSQQVVHQQTQQHPGSSSVIIDQSSSHQQPSTSQLPSTSRLLPESSIHQQAAKTLESLLHSKKSTPGSVGPTTSQSGLRTIVRKTPYDRPTSISSDRVLKFSNKINKM